MRQNCTPDRIRHIVVTHPLDIKFENLRDSSSSHQTTRMPPIVKTFSPRKPRSSPVSMHPESVRVERLANLEQDGMLRDKESRANIVSGDQEQRLP